MGCYCHLRNIQDLLSDWKTPCGKRFGKTLDGPVIPFEAMVEYHPLSAEDLSRLHQCGPKCCQINSLDMHCTRGESGKETFLFQTLKSWIRWTLLQSTPKGSMLKKRFMVNVKFCIPNRRWNSLLEDSGGLSSPPTQQDHSTRDYTEARKDFSSVTGKLICRHHEVKPFHSNNVDFSPSQCWLIRWETELRGKVMKVNAWRVARYRPKTTQVLHSPLIVSPSFH